MSLLLLFGQTPPVAKSDTDTGTGTDTHTALDIIEPLANSDTGTGTDTESLSITRFFTESDTGTGTDAHFLAREWFQSDTGTGTESQSVVATFVYTTPIEVLSVQSATLRQSAPTTPDPLSAFIRLDGTGAAELRGLLDLPNPVPTGVNASVLHADLLLTLGSGWATGDVLTVKLLDAGFNSYETTWNTAPGVRASSATYTILSTDTSGTQITVDVTSLLSEAVSTEDASGTRFYGFRLTKGNTGEALIYGANAATPPDYQARMKVEKSIPPVAPTNPRPSDAQKVGESKPIFLWDFLDADAEDTLASVQFQISTVDTFATTFYDSTAISHTGSYFDTNSPPTGAPAMTALTASTTYYWRAKHADNHGEWSDWSEPVSFSYIANITVAWASTASTETSPTPTWTWTVSGGTQARYHAYVERKESGVWVPHYDPGWATGTTATLSLPSDYALAEGESYRRVIESTDSNNRADLPGDRSFASHTVEFSLTTVS